MKTNKTFTLKKIALALVIAGFAMTSAYAAVTGATGSIRGQIPILKSTTDASHSVDFASSDPAALKTGDTITMTYKYTDTDGDADESTTTVQWYYVPANGGGIPVPITASSSSSATGLTDGTASGTSAIIIPSTAIGAKIKAVITEQSTTGDLKTGHTITYNDVSEQGEFGPGPDGEPGGNTGGNTDVPTGPVEPGTDSTAWIVDDAAPTVNLIGATQKLQVGHSYTFKLMAADGSTDITDTVNYKWKLNGTSATALTPAPATFFNDNQGWTAPTNTDAQTLVVSPDGVQGYSIIVDYVAKP